MSLIINSNISSLIAQNNLSKTQSSLQTSLQRLSSGLRINSAADDAAGLAIATTMNAQVQSMNQATRNANDGISLVQTADGALNETSNILTRMRELAVQSASGTLNDGTDRTYIANEFSQLQDEIDRIANSTQFNKQDLLTGAGGAAGDGSFVIQVGAGNALEIYDFMIYGYYARYIAQTYFPSDNEHVSLMLSLMTFAFGFLARPVGATQPEATASPEFVVRKYRRSDHRWRSRSGVPGGHLGADCA